MRASILEQDLSFKFRYVAADGNVKGFFVSKKGKATPGHLELDGHQLPYTAILDTTTRDSRLVMVVDRELTPPPIQNELLNAKTLVLEVYKVKALDLERRIDVYSSAKLAQQHKLELEQAGKGELYRAELCPVCSATVDLSELDETEYIYCRFCESVFTKDSIIAQGDQYRICDECDFFGRVQGYTEFYFYFLLVVYGYSMKRRHLCDACANSLCWKMLAYNLPFILGLPNALWQKYRSISGRDPKLASLSKANQLLKKGQVRPAQELYDQMQYRYPNHPGFHYNLALGHIFAKDLESALKHLNSSLEHCSNYLPSIRLAHSLEEELNKAIATSQ